MVVDKDVKFVNSNLRAKGIKHGVIAVERSHFVDAEGELREDVMQWQEDRKHFSTPFLLNMTGCLVWLRCIPADPDDLFKLKNWLLWAQWMALICDFAAAVVAITTFTDVTYCCGEPILNIAGSVPWKEMIRVLTYIYLGLVFMEVYPVVQKGVPINIINPIIGFTITFAMFFSDTLRQALTMWCVESAAVVCEYVLYRLKIRQAFLRDKEVVNVGRKTQMRRSVKEGEDPDAPARELSEARQKYYQLKQDQLNDHTLTWYLGIGCYLNILLGIAMLTMILVVNRGGGLCINDFQVPNPFWSDQLSRCPLCEGTSGVCEICRDDVQECFYPYS